MKNCQNKIIRLEMERIGAWNRIVHIHDANYSMKHIHNFWEIHICLDNTFINSINDKEGLMCENDMCLIRPDDVHCIKKYGGSNGRVMNFEIETEYLKQIFDLWDKNLYEEIINEKKSLVVHSDVVFMKKINKYVESAQACQEPSSRESYLKQAINLMLLEWIDLFYKKNKTKGGLIKNIISLMKSGDNIDKSFNQICEIAGYNKSHVTRVFKKEKLDTPNNEFRKIKIGFACELLVCTDMTVLDIMYRVGYQSIGNFNVLFKKIIGCTPTEYRRKNVSIANL